MTMFYDCFWYEKGGRCKIDKNHCTYRTTNECEKDNEKPLISNLNNVPRVEIKDVYNSVIVRVVEEEGGIIKQYCNIARLDYGDGYLDKQQALKWAEQIVLYNNRWGL